MKKGRRKIHSEAYIGKLRESINLNLIQKEWIEDRLDEPLWNLGIDYGFLIDDLAFLEKKRCAYYSILDRLIL